jgi:hypothetical protein
MGVGFIAMLVAGCSDMGGPTPMTIVNRTAGSVDVTVHYALSSGADSPTAVMTLPSGETRLLYGPYFEGCMTGNLVATQGGRTVATIEKPCEGSRWEITPPVASPSS